VLTEAGPTVAASTLPLPVLRAPDGRLDGSRLREDLALVKSCGSSIVDLTDTWLPISEMAPGEVDVLRDVLVSLDLVACGVSLVRHSILDPVAGAQNIAHTLRAIELAEALGAPIVSIGFHEPLPRRAQAVPFWSVEMPLGDRADPVPLVRSLADAAASRGVSLALELYEGGPLGSGRLAVDMVGRVARPNVGVNLDVGNLLRSPLAEGETWLECVLTCLPHTIFWHAKNFQQVYEHPTGRLVGSVPATLPDGDIDYRRCLAAAKEAGYRGPITVEHYGGDGITAQRTGVAYLQELLAWS
jgi:sugar phosphate isomerase/epimerase